MKVSGRSENSIDGVKYFEHLLQDGGKFNAQEILIPKKLILVKSVTVPQDLGKVTVHQDLSHYTKPGTHDLNGSEIIQVHEQEEHWVVSLKQGRKRLRETTEECLIVT